MTRCLVSNVTETVTEVPNEQGGAGLTVLVKYLPEEALIIGDELFSMNVLTSAAVEHDPLPVH